ncbi:GntR family transcriptional regulator [uncultured Corynebacterium sp.]|uniref:GntR family transcriptional regulator n=1 Tax=uncultured Corynebacterium sp. TaxID=159447 RepID=UPI0025953510|nr:GntR family transcriptional regulator [uncultured Corynebacterium sp.]
MVVGDSEPLFVQIAKLVEDLIVDGTLKSGERAPSTNELAAFHNINPATARKGLGLLVDAQVLEKRRGLGMFVTPDARERILETRREAFPGTFVAPLIDEAVRVGLSRDELIDLVHRVAESRGMYQ